MDFRHAYTTSGPDGIAAYFAGSDSATVVTVFATVKEGCVRGAMAQVTNLATGKTSPLIFGAGIITGEAATEGRLLVSNAIAKALRAVGSAV